MSAKIKKLPAKTMSVLELVFEGKDKDEIMNELNMKALSYNNISKRLVKDGFVEDNDGFLEPTDEVIAFFEGSEEEPSEDVAEEEAAEEEPAAKPKGRKKTTTKKKTSKKKAEVAELDEVLEALNTLMDPETPLESEEDVKELVVGNTDQFEKEDAKELSDGVIAYIEAMAKKGKVLMPWQEKPKRKAPKKVDKGPGVVASIVEFLQEGKYTRKELVDKL